MSRIVAFCLVMVFLSGCQTTGLFLANLSNDQETFSQKSNIAYGENAWQKLDVYTPVNVQAPYPTVVFYYGGSWVGGSKDKYTFVANRLVREGFAVIIPDYIKYPDGKYPAFVEDAALVTKWIEDNSDRFNFDQNNIHIMGHSAGAHVGAMLVVDNRFLEPFDLTPDFYKSFIGLAGPYDFVPSSRRYEAIFGPEERFPLMQATNFIEGDEPPMFLLIAANDWLVGRSNATKLINAIERKNGQVQSKIYERMGHMTLIGSFSDSFPLGDQVINDIIKFINSAS